MKKFAIIMGLLFFSGMANANDWSYDIEGQAIGLYGYTDTAPHNTGIGRGHISAMVEYALTNDTVASLNLNLNGGINRELQSYNQGRWGEEVYGVFDSPYGQIMLGQVFNVAGLFHNGAPRVGAFSSNNDIVDFISNPNWQRDSKATNFATLNSTDINTDGVAPKINYISPEFLGTAVGFSYMPDSYNRRGLINKHASYAHSDGFVVAAYNDHDWGFFSSQASVGYGQYHGNDKEYSVSLKLSRGNWSLGGGFRKTYIDGDDKSSPKYGLPLYFDAYREGYAWDIGIGYEIGPFSSSLSYFDSKASLSKNRNKIVAFSNQYQFNKYIDLYCAATYVDYDSPQEDVKGYGIITGLGVNF